VPPRIAPCLAYGGNITHARFIGPRLRPHSRCSRPAQWEAACRSRSRPAPPGLVGFLALKTVKGARIATGDATQIVHGDRVTSRVIFRFRDGQSTRTSLSSPNVASSVLSATTTFNAAHPSRDPWTFSSTRPPGRLRLVRKTESETRSSGPATPRLKRPSAQSADERPSVHA
jgi:hypothetical protein